MNYLTEFKIQQLRTKNVIAGVESIAIVLGTILANMLLPQLLLQYVYTDQTALLEPPMIFTYLPLVTYGFALLYFLYAMIGNFARSRKASVLEQELSLTGDSCGCDCDDGCGCGDKHTDSEGEISEAELAELEKIVDEALKPKKEVSEKKAPKKNKKKSSKK